MFGGPRAVDFVVRSHHRACAGADSRFKPGQLDLVHRLLIDIRTDRLPLVLLIVEREVFDGRDQASGLNALNFRRDQSTGEQRIFSECLEVSARLRDPHDVDHRREDDVLMTRAAIERDRLAVVVSEID